MTEDYKTKLLKYMTGNIEPETGNNEPQFIDKGLLNQNIFDYLNNYFTGYHWGYYGELMAPNSEFMIIYGTYYETDLSDANGFLYIVKQDMEAVALVTAYESGTTFKSFVSLSIDEDGYLYGIDAEDLSPQAPTPKFRFIMLNKVFSSFANGTNKVKLRQSYYLPTSLNNYRFWFQLATGVKLCHKSIGSANYYFLTSLWNMNFDTSEGLGVIGLTINVGASNNWNLARIAGNAEYVSSFDKYDNSNNFSMIVGVKAITMANSFKECLYTPGETPTLVVQDTFTIQGTGYIGAVEKISIDKSYVFGLIPDGSTITVKIYITNYSNDTLEEIYTFTTAYDFVEYVVDMVNVNGNLFFEYFWRYEENSTQMMSSYIGMIIDRDVYYINGASWEYQGTQSKPHLYITSIYNLFTLYAPTDETTTKKIQLVYNVNNYNGLPYEDVNCLLPNSAILYDDNNNIIFARNLYNKTVLGATTTSTVQIPNTMLNDAIIGESDLISATNLTLTEDTTEITKNIYETVDINFANSISIRNDNDPNNTILNPKASTRLNGSVSQNGNYNDVQATKVRINYSDGTNMILALTPSVQIIALSDTTYQYNFILSVSKNIDSLEIISNDELTSYQTIDNLTLEVGKTYNILQEVEIQ